MLEMPDNFYTRQDDIARLEALALELDDEAVVELHLTDGSVISGIVSVRPTVQVFRDGLGREGFNAALRIDDQSRAQSPHWLWLDRVQSVVRLGSA